MFTVYSRVGNYRVCIHDDSVADPTVKLIDPTLDLEQNTAGTFTFTLAPNNIGYQEHTVSVEMVDSITTSGDVTTRTVTTQVDLVGRMQSTITIYRDNVEIWEGRVLSEERDWYNRRMITCEGELAYLNDTCQQSKRYHDITLSNFVGVVLNLHNSKVDDSKKFYVGTIDVQNPEGDTGWYDTQYESTMETINKLVSDFGGILSITKQDGKRYLNWRKTYTNVSTQTINFGKNLLDYKCTWDMSSLCTVLLPTGAVIENAGADSIGSPMTPVNTGGVPTSGQLLYLDENNNVQINNNEGLGGYKTAVYNVTTSSAVNPTSVYISCRLHGGLVCFVAKSESGGGGTQLSYITATQDTGYAFKDYVDYKVTLPPGTNSFIVCSFGNDIPLTVKSNIPGTTTTVTGTVIQPSYAVASGQVVYEDDNQLAQLQNVSDTNYKVYTYDISSTSANPKKIYVTARINGGLVPFVAQSSTGGFNPSAQLWHLKSSVPSDGSCFVDYVNYEINLPAGTNEFIVCSYDSGLPVKVMENITTTTENTADAALDKYLTVEECDDDAGWHSKGSQYVVYQELVDKYGWIEKGLALEEIEDKDVLYTTAKKYLQEGMFDEMTLELSAIDLKMLGVESQYINLLDQVYAISEPHSLNKLLPVTKLSMPLTKPDSFKYTLGTQTTNSLTDTNNEINEETLAKISIKTSETLTSAQRDAAAMISTATNGFISFINDEEGNPKELVISNTKDPTMCTSCWIWNVNGLGHADHYPLTIGDTVNVAMTMDGSIVADRITTGILTGILIRGVTLVLGGMDQSPGSLLIKSGDSTGYCVEGKEGGLFFGTLQAISDPSSQSPYGTYETVPHGHLIGNIEFQTGSGLKHGVAFDSQVIAIDCDELWVTTDSHYSGGGRDAVGGLDLQNINLAVSDGQGGYSYVGPYDVRHGIIVGHVDP